MDMALRLQDEHADSPIFNSWPSGQSMSIMAGDALYAALFEKDIHRLDLHGLPLSHQEGPEILNVLRFTDIPQIAAMAGEKSQLRLYTGDVAKWSYLTEFAKKLAWPEKQLQIRVPEGKE